MEGVRTFLEESTIHGLTYISTTRKYVRLFWILVVIAGFVGASLIIKESFDSWSESPVTTTIETLPIDEIRFPKLMVCPPKNTFTDLNYDLMITENITLTQEMRDEMFEYALDVINEGRLSESNWTKLHEENRAYNWYHGYTMILPPYSTIGDNGLNFFLSTAATSGVITTQYYGEQFRPELVERKLYINVRIYSPRSVMHNENVTLHLKVEKVSMKGLMWFSQDKVEMHGFDRITADQKTAYTNFTPPGSVKEMILNRKVLRYDEEVLTQKLHLMPGLRFSWWYTGADVTPDNKYKDEEMTKHFVR